MLCLLESNLEMDGLFTVVSVSLSDVVTGSVVPNTTLFLERLRVVLGIDLGRLCPLNLGIVGYDDYLSLSVDDSRTNHQS